MNLALLMHSLAVGLGASALALALGWAVALTMAWMPRRLRWCWKWMSVIALVSPPFVPANAWLNWTSAIRTALGPEREAHWMLPVTALVLGLQYWPVATGLVWASWSRISRELVEADPQLQGGAFIRWLLAPAAMEATRIAGVLTLALSIGQFSVPVLFQVPVLTEEFWVRFNTRLSVGEALVSTWPLILMPGLALLHLGRRRVPWKPGPWSIPSALFRERLGWLRWGALMMATFAVLAAVAFPLADLVCARRTWLELPGAWRAGREAAVNSLVLAIGTSVGVIALGWIAACIGRDPGRWLQRGLGLGWVAFLLPGIATGVLVLSVTQREALAWLGDSILVMVVALGLRWIAPVAWMLRDARRSLSPDATESLELDGAGAWIRFRHGTWPQLGAMTMACAALLFLMTLWDVETIVLIQPPGGETLALRIFNLLHYGHAAQVNALCVVLLALASLPLVLGGLAGWWRQCNPRIRRGCPAAFVAAVAVLSGCERRPSPHGRPVESVLFERVDVIGGRGVAPGQFHKPRSVTCDRDGNLYVADITGRIQKFTTDGRFVQQWQMPETDLGKPKGMGMDGDGNILVVEPHYQRVNHFSTNGVLVSQWGRRGTNAGEMILPRSIAQNGRGEFLVSEYTVVDRIQRFDARGRFLGGWGRPGLGAGEFNRAEGLAIGPGDTVYVADSCNHRIQVFDAGGRFLRGHGTAGNGPGQFSYPYDVRVEPGGLQFVCEFGNSRISILDATDAVVEILGGPGSDPGRFANPWAICLDPQGNLYVADSQNHRVQKFTRRRQSGLTGDRRRGTAPG